jgi:hypothetical protein
MIKRCRHRIGNRLCKKNGTHKSSDGNSYCTQHLIKNVYPLPENDKQLTDHTKFYIGQYFYSARYDDNYNFTYYQHISSGKK